MHGGDVAIYGPKLSSCWSKMKGRAYMLIARFEMWQVKLAWRENEIWVKIRVVKHLNWPYKLLMLFIPIPPTTPAISAS